MRYVYQKEKENIKVSFHDDKPTYPMPVISYKRRPTIWATTCSVTGQRIPWFTMAYQKHTEYAIRDEIHTDFAWVSEAGYMLEKLKGNL